MNMSYDSVDQLQKTLTKNIFGYAKDSKKAAGRALGTIVEIITFYLLKSWGLNNSILIEKRIPEFIEEVIFNPLKKYISIKKAFLASYSANKKKNQFTKVQMNIEADTQLIKYFSKNKKKIKGWFNIISTAKGNIKKLRAEIQTLHKKQWSTILK